MENEINNDRETRSNVPEDSRTPWRNSPIPFWARSNGSFAANNAHSLALVFGHTSYTIPKEDDPDEDIAPFDCNTCDRVNVALLSPFSDSVYPSSCYPFL